MNHALLDEKVFNRHLMDPSKEKMKAVNIVQIESDAAQPFYTIAMYIGNKWSVTGARDLGVVVKKMTAEKLTYGQIKWLDLGMTAAEIVSNIKCMDFNDIKERIDFALS
jgi:1,4-dihydroxy-2-naphthoate octaprenyltransferase